MGIVNSMNIGVTGISAQGNQLDIIGDNISNVSTNGFKASRGEFSDMVSRNLKGIEGGNQIGRGTQLRSVTPIFNQGSIIRTERATDLAINGDGFFVVKAGNGELNYSRDGALRFNKDGELVNMEGLNIMGYLANTEGKISPQLEKVSIPTNTIAAKGTDKVKLSINIDAREPIGVPFNPMKPADTSIFSSGVTIYDSKGTAHIATLFFNKIGENQYEYNAMVDGAEVVGGEKGKLSLQASGTLLFDKDGRLLSETVKSNGFNFIGGADLNQQVEFDFGDAVTTENGTGLAGSTQFGTSSVMYKYNQNGHEAGNLTSMSVNEDGVITGLFSNGITRDLAQLGLAKFENNEGLVKIGGNNFRESKLSGAAYIGKAGEAGRGTFLAKALEQSTTDIAQEFVNLILAQRGFQANSKIITTSDELLNDIINLKR